MRQQAMRQALTDERIMQISRENTVLNGSHELCNYVAFARAVLSAAIEANDAKDAALADLAAAVKFQDQVREGAKLGEQVTGTGIARDAREWIDRAARAVVAAMSTHQPKESGNG